MSLLKNTDKAMKNKKRTGSRKKEYIPLGGSDMAKKSTRKPATRSQRRQAERVRKQEHEAKKIREKNKKRALAGKKTKKDPAEHKPSIWEKIAEEKVYYQLRQMGDSTKNIDKFQKKRVRLGLLVFLLVGVLGGMFIHVWLYLGGLIAGFIAYKMQAKKVDNFYKGWKFERQLNFSKFTRLVIPYLKASGGNMALYTVFNKILKRTDNEADRRNLYQLMGEMGDNPTDIQPFLDYAERSSGTDMSYLFMSTIFDFQQSTFDTQVIDELGQMASEDMMNAIDEIIEFKLRRFIMFPTKVTMSSFILVAGLGVGMMLHNFNSIGFSTDMFAPPTTQSVENTVETAGNADEKEADTETKSEEIQETQEEPASKPQQENQDIIVRPEQSGSASQE